jgi:hypothetical protein
MGWFMELFKMRFLGYQSMVIKANADNSIEFKASKKPVIKVKFQRENRLLERGAPEVFFAAIEKIKHNLKGTSKPIHFVVDGAYKNVGLLDKYRQETDLEEIVKLGTLSYEAGWEARGMMGKPGGLDLNRALVYLIIFLILIGLGNVAMGWISLSGGF